MRQLLILGNGFDLQAKLPSTYNDFFNERITSDMKQVLDHAFQMYEKKDSSKKYNHIMNIKRNGSIELFLNKSLDSIVSFFSQFDDDQTELINLTFWDLYLYYLQNINDKEWHIIEQQIYNFLTAKNKDIWQSMDNFFNGKVIFNNQIAVIVSSFFSSTLPVHQYSEKTTYINFLKNELKRLETSFSAYLRRAIKSQPFYHENSRKLIASLATGSKYLLQLKNNTITDDLLKQSLDDLTILNFNYTDPIEFSNREFSPDSSTNGELLLSHISQSVWNGVYERTLHVHGSINEMNAIFGIDSTDVETDSLIYRFTKTYKQLIGNYGANAVPTKIPNKSSTGVLAFYGHSLSPLDYSYFQSLFDYYSIYDSKIHLIFYYSVYGDKPDFDSIRQSQVERVLNLLSSYAKTISNEDHGKNLIHKLSLEQRLSVVQLIPTQPTWNLLDTDGSLDPMFKRN